MRSSVPEIVAAQAPAASEHGPFARALLVTGFYLIATVVFTWPLAVSLGTALGAPEGPGDPYLNLWILGWDLRALASHPAWLVDGRIFDATIFHPAAGTLTYSDHLLPQAIAVLPLYMATRDPVLCYNVLLFASFVASGLAMHVLARTVGAAPMAAAVAGLAWAFWPYRIAHLIHLQLQALYFLPLALVALHRTVGGNRRRDAVWLGVLAGLQALSSIYYGVMTALALGVGILGLGLGTGRLRSARLISRLALAVLIGSVLVAPIVWPYWQMQRNEGFSRNLYEASRHAAVASSYLQVSERNLVYGRTHLLTARDAAGQLRPGRVEGVEHALFPGVVLPLLGAVGLIATRRQATWPVGASMTALIVVGAVLSLGPDGVRPLYAALHRLVFGFQAVRAPARFGVLVMLGLAVLAALGATRLLRGPRGRWLVAALLVGLCLEYASMPWLLVARPPLHTAVGQWLATAPGAGAVLYLPLTSDRQNTIAMVDSLQHGRPILNGYSGQRPSFFAALVDTLSTFPTAEALWTLRDFGVRFVVSPGPLPTTMTPALASRGIIPIADSPLVMRAQLAEGVIYELVWSEAIEARLAPPAPAPPPPPGPIPFAPSERLSYQVKWVGGPVDLSAGRVTLAVEAGASNDVPYRFVATADTAPWVTRFFEAHDRFETDADRNLLPQTHRRRLREGRRSLDRVYSFDRRAGIVRIGAPGAPDTLVPFRIPPGTRDALTTLFYVRTLPLADGDTVVLPVNDGGRNLVTHVNVVRREVIAINGRRVEAIRVEPVIAERVPRRAPVQSVVWLSTDTRRIVLAADIAAGFGELRLELVP